VSVCFQLTVGDAVSCSDKCSACLRGRRTENWPSTFYLHQQDWVTGKVLAEPHGTIILLVHCKTTDTGLVHHVVLTAPTS